MFTEGLPADQLVLQPSSTNTPPPRVLSSPSQETAVSSHASQNRNLRNSTSKASWEYLLNSQKKERMAGYVRESDEGLADSVTIDSAAKAIREYGASKGYVYEPQHEYKEALSAYYVPYYKRPRLMAMLKAAEQGLFDVLVITEVRSLSRTGAGEVFIIYESLKKAGIRLETISGKAFENTTMGQMILGYEATYAAMEREQSYLRMQRGKKDRIEIGLAPNGHPFPSYGYVFVDTAREVKGGYAFNHTIVCVDADNKAWSPYLVRLYIFDLAKEHYSVHAIARRLNDLGIPPPRKALKCDPHWTPSSVYRMLTDLMAIGQVWNNRYQRVKNEPSGKYSMVQRPKEEWVRLPDCPRLIDDDDSFEAIQLQLEWNKQDSLRSNRHEEIGLLRSGFIFCGICKRRMKVSYPSPAGLKNGNTPVYECKRKVATDHLLNHRTQIHVTYVDNAAREKIREALLHPECIRAAVWEMREQHKEVVDNESVYKAVAEIETQMENIINLGKHASNKETIERFGRELEELERQRAHIEATLFDLEEEEQEREDIETTLRKFESWVEEVKPHLTDPDYLKNASYEELRLAVHILGVRAIVYPTQGDHPFRLQIGATVPEVMKKINPSFSIDPSISSPLAP